MSLLGFVFVVMGLKILFADPKYSDGTPAPQESFLGWLFGIEDVPEGKERAVRAGEDFIGWLQGKTTRDP